MDRGAEGSLASSVLKLLDKGVRMPAPSLVEVGPEVDPDRISGAGVVFHGGTRVHGAKTLISAGTQLGGEAPVTVVDCQLGRDVALKGGFFTASVFLDRANFGSGAQVREGCLIEEEAGGGHTVGLKQTLLFPFATLGSLVNFCDCFLAGGTSRKDHSEVGSSYIHFNYTPNQDKATASLLGDVPRGVMLQERPIFLGGQGGLVGPARIGFGTVIAAGSVWRGDFPEGGMLLKGGTVSGPAQPFHPGLYGDIRRRVTNNIFYIANLLALRQWYLHVRLTAPADGEMGDALWVGALATLEGAIAERIARFRDLAEKMGISLALAEKGLPPERADRREAIMGQQRELQERWPAVEARLTDRREGSAGRAARDGFLENLLAARAAQGNDHLRVIRSLNPTARALGTAWLTEVVDAVAAGVQAEIPACLQVRS
ncbi:MAG: UDP-N-acetylglucosamine pyrophosphorylase [Deltaproteobacteria bacterium]|nr:UDP-N-acetylglucosamine pyrophosphorylase [Deltaproteobacteria bacterium]